ncbi:TonB-dependent receptor [Flavobacterium sp. MXW15]|uniref:TonB-dependent receptor n=1 Tax=Xanthomonas chitinilytica TaxID=2989819 RepID=A0ABT3JV43_9XANT|nr:TonB-dependent receptor [Xanthomonas sp. H13-6]MCW4455011.1 TonB-dependent receptor [Flavobacterium sp. MXW15]MCW4472362.1 TonB-dependent receptor [Xanthomonas sp. H13-6]
MNCKTNKLRDAVVFALVVGAGSSGVAIAQESGSTTNLDRIEVTGSRIRQVDVESAQPVLTISRQDIESQGFSSVADILQNISAAGSPSFSRASPLTSNQEAGGQYIDLRNLGAQRTLVLVNGKRLGISPNGYQDVSSIPSVMVERIEVLKDGASSIYGSDAMAGVINIITRKNFEGAEANAYIGQYSQGDGKKQSYDFMVGFSGERGSVTVGAEYHKEEAVWAQDRWFSEDTRPGYPTSGLTTVGQWGNWRRVGAASTAPWYAPNRGSDALEESDFHVQTMDDTSRSSDQMHLLTPLERRALYVNANYDITDNIRFTTDIGYTKRESFRQIAGYPLQSTAVDAPMSTDSYFNPTGGDSVVDWRRRGWEVPRTTATDQTTWRFTAALEGSFEIGERYFDWDAGYLFNESDTSIVNNGNFYIPAVQAAVGPSFLNSSGQVQCGTAANPISLTECVPWNPFAGFGTGAVANSLDDEAVRNFLFREEHAIGNTKTNSYFANLAGSLFALPAGDLGFAVGYEYRKEEGGFSPDAISQSGNSTNLAAGSTYGSYAVDEVYLELNVPILANLPGAQELTFNAATRYSDFNTFGDTTNNKFGLKWRPIDDLLVRATYAEGFRAPTIGNLYGGGSQTFTTGFADPCDSVYGVARGSARCLQDVAADYRQLKQGFVPTTSSSDQTPVPFTSGSNPNLQPEKSESKTIGLVYSPSFVSGLTASVDWWSIRIDDTMVSDSPNLIVEDCYVALIESRCANFTRDPVTGIVTNLKYGLRNAGYTETEGFDVDLNYAFETGFGRFTAKWATTYVSKYESKATNDPATVPNQWNGRNAYFRTRSNFNLNWKLEDWSVNWGVRYYSGTKENCSYSDRCNIPDWAAPETLGRIVPKNQLGSNAFHDLQVSWSAPWDARIAVGANNVFNHYAAPMYSQQSSNFAYYGGFDIGRFVYVKYQQNF